MAFSTRQKRKFTISGIIITTGFLLGIFYASLSDGFDHIFPFINGAITGTFVGLVISVLELQVFDTRARRLPFVSLLLLRTILYVIFIPSVIFFELITARVVRFEMSYREVYFSDEFQNYLQNEDFSVVIAYTVVLSLLVNFTYQISRKMGQGMLWNYITGKYRNPVTQERIFLFMHIANSKEIIDQIGSTGFLEFLNRILYDITESILMYKGVIYEYVEDECVVSWKLDHGVKKNNCLKSVFDILQTIEKNQEYYRNKFGFIPRYEMSLHKGRVLQGEVGVIKSEVAFYGNAMNITARILAKCSELGKRILVSKDVITMLNSPLPYMVEYLGKHNLKGKSQPIELFAISKNGSNS